MKLYRIGRQHAGTQADAKAASKAHGAPWSDVDVPTDKIGLMAYLNALANDDAITVTGQPLEIIKAPELFHSAPPETPAATAAKAARADQVARDITIEEAIAAADYGRALALAHHIHHRLMEHARAAG